MTYFHFKDANRSLVARTKNRYAALDGLRALSIIVIIFFHTYFVFAGYVSEAYFRAFTDTIPLFLRWLVHGDYSVDLFFVLSGFLVGGLLLREYQSTQRFDIKRFYLRRTARLYPTYLLLILLTAIPLWLSSKPEASVTLRQLWANVFYVLNFLPYDEMRLKWTWSLAVEEQFYLILPALLFMAFRLKKVFIALIGLIILSLLIRALIIAQYPAILSTDFLNQAFAHFEHFDPTAFETLYDNFYSRFGVMILGVLLAYFYTFHNQRCAAIVSRPLVNGLLALLGCGISGAMMLQSVTYTEQTPGIPSQWWYQMGHRHLFGLAITLMMACCLWPARGIGQWLNRFLSLKLFFPIAQLSYSMYLFHLPVVGLVCANGIYWITPEAVTPFTLLYLSLGGIAINILVAYIVYITVEYPFLRLRDNTAATAKKH